MKCLESALFPIRDGMLEFLRNKEIRLFHVSTDVPMRTGVNFTIVSYSNNPKNPEWSMFFEEPYSAAAPNWRARSDNIRGGFEMYRRQMRQMGHWVPALPQKRHPRDPRRDFLENASRLAEIVLEEADSPVPGLFFILTPPFLEQPASLANDLRVVLHEPRLAAARWIWIEVESREGAALADELGAAGRSLDCRLDGEAWKKDLQETTLRVIGFEEMARKFAERHSLPRPPAAPPSGAAN